MTRRRVLGALCGSFALAAGGARAQGRRPWRDHQPRGPRARRALREAVRRGEIRPLRALIADFEARTGMEVIDVRYHREGDEHLYAFRALSAEGRLDRFVMNAATGEILTVGQARERYR